jgi:hypothetical protein
MTIKGSQRFKEKVRALVELGLGEAKVHRFIKEKSKVLTMAGVRNSSNLPRDFDRRVEFIATLFEHREHTAVLLDWIRTHADFGATIDAADAMRELSAMEPKLAIDPDNAILWRSILVSLMSEPDSVEIKAFLDGPPKKPKHVPGTPDKEGPMGNLDEAIRVAKGEVIPDRKEGLFTTFIGGVAEIAAGNRESVEKLVSDLGASQSPVARQYASLVSALLSRSANVLPCRRGLEVRDTALSLPAGIAGQHQYKALGRMTSLPGAGHRFFEIFAVVHDDGVYRLDKPGAMKLFPHRGSAILFAGKAAANVVSWGSEWVLTLKLIDGSHEHTAQFEVASLDRRLGEVIPIHHKSSEPDKIRAAIGAHQLKSGMKPFFELADGYVMPVGSFPPNFDEPLGYLETLVAYELDGRKLIVDESDSFDGFIDCSPPEISVRRLFRARTELGDIPQITKAQIAKLADLAGQERKFGTIGSSIRRAQEHIDELLALKETVSSVVQDLLATPAVSESLELEKQRILTEYKGSVASQRQELDELLGKKQQVEAEIKRLNDQQEAQAGQLGKHLRDAFGKAAEDGVKVLSNVALLSPFLIGKQGVVTEDALGMAKASGTPARDPTAIFGGVVGFAHRHGLPTSVLCQAIASSIANGLICLSGAATPLFQQAIAVTLTGTLSATVSLSGDMFGWGDVLAAPVATSLPGCPAMSLGEFIVLAQRSKVPAHVSIIGANRIPPESYMAELLSVAGFRGIGNAISWRRSDGKLLSARLVMPVFFSLTFANGKATFQVSAPLSAMLPFINCDADWDPRPHRETSMQVSVTYVLMPNHGDHSNGGHSPNAEDEAAAYMKAWAVPEGDANVLARLSHRLGRASKEDLESEAGRLQGRLGERYLAYVRHEGTDLISDIFAPAGGLGK